MFSQGREEQHEKCDFHAKYGTKQSTTLSRVLTFVESDPESRVFPWKGPWYLELDLGAELDELGSITLFAKGFLSADHYPMQNLICETL